MTNNEHDEVPVVGRDALSPLDQGRLLTAQEVAAYVGLPVLTVYYHARQGIIPGAVRIGRRVMFNPDELRRWVAAGGQAFAGGWRKEPR